MRNLSLALATDGPPFTGSSPEEQALGGSETALVQMARALKNRGHRIQVFCNCPQPGLYQGVLYRSRQDIVKAVGEERFDALVVSRFLPVLDLPWQAGVRILWNHDLLDIPHALRERLPGLDACLVLSRYHAANYLSRLPELSSKLAITRNGLDLSLLARASQGVARVEGRLTYVSRPERGLRLLLEEIWPRLLLDMPHLTLSLCGYQIEEEDLPQAVIDEYAHISKLIKTSPRVENLGPLPKEQYYAHLASCQALLYPCIFPEISCLAVLEAQALGTPLITTDGFALKESVLTSEFRVAGQPGSPGYVENYLARCREILGNADKTRELILEAQRRIHLSYDWSEIAEEWEEMILKLAYGQEREHRAALSAALLLSGDQRQAERIHGSPLPAPPQEGVEIPPPDPDENGLLNHILNGLSPCLRDFAHQGAIALVEPEARRSLDALAPYLPGCSLIALRPGQPLEDQQGGCVAVIIRDMLERVAFPHELLRWAISISHPEAWIVICTASGAWPLISHGYLNRLYDLGREDIINLLPGRPVFMTYLPRGLVGRGSERMAVGRWLALAKISGPAPAPLSEENRVRWVRPVNQTILTEIYNAGLL
jgi:glycosyltransferase involved in cell wall biosynthesis